MTVLCLEVTVLYPTGCRIISMSLSQLLHSSLHLEVVCPETFLESWAEESSSLMQNLGLHIPFGLWSLAVISLVID